MRGLWVLSAQGFKPDRSLKPSPLYASSSAFELSAGISGGGPTGGPPPNASSPVVEGRGLAPGTHINAIGANFAQKRELDDETVRRADIIAVDSREQSKMEAGDLIHALNGDLAG